MMATAESLPKVLNLNNTLAEKDRETSSSMPFSEESNFSPNSPPTEMHQNDHEEGAMSLHDNQHVAEDLDGPNLKANNGGDSYNEDEDNRFAYPCALEGDNDIKPMTQTSNSSNNVSASRCSPLSSESQAMSSSPPMIMEEEDIKDPSGLPNANQDYNAEFASPKQLSSPLKGQYNGRRHSMEELLSPAANPMHSSALNESLSNKRGYYKTYTREQLMKALEAVQTAKMSGEQAAKFFKVPRSTLHHHLRPMQYWCVYCQKDLRYKIEWKEHMATHKKKGSSSNKGSRANHSAETKLAAAELTVKDQSSMVNGNHHKNNIDHSDPWPTEPSNHYITSSNPLATNQKIASQKKDLAAKTYSESFTRVEPATKFIPSGNTHHKETDSLNNTRNAMPHRVTKHNYASDNYNGGSTGLGSASNGDTQESNNYMDNQALPSTTMAAILYQGLANGSPAFTEYLTKLTRECPEGIDQLKYLSDYYYHNYYQQYEALNKRKQMSEYSTNPKSKSDGYGNLPEDPKRSPINSSNTFSSDTLREYLLQGKVSTGQQPWDKTKGYENTQQSRLYDNKTIKETITKKDAIPLTYPSQNYSNELRGLMNKSENEQRCLSPPVEYVCALCAITSNDKEQFLNHLFLHNQIFLVSNVNGTASNGTEKPNLKELNLSLLKTVADITRMLDNIYQVDGVHGSWESLLNNVSCTPNNSEASAKNSAINGNYENKVKINGIAKRDKPRISTLAAFGAGNQQNFLSSIGNSDKEFTKTNHSHLATSNAYHQSALNYDKMHQDENILKSLYQFPNLDQRLFKKPHNTMAHQNPSSKTDGSNSNKHHVAKELNYPMDLCSGLPFLAALKFNQQLEEEHINGYKETLKSDASSRSTSLEIDEGQGDNKSNANDLARYSVSERDSNESPDCRQDNNTLTSYSDLIKRLSKLYQDPEGKFNISMETLKQKFSKHIADASLNEKHNNKDHSGEVACNNTPKSNSHPTLTNNTFSSGNKRKAKFPLRLGSKQFCSQNVISTSLTST